MNHFRAFIAGIVVPNIILPVAMMVALALGKPAVLALPCMHYIPAAWGIWNLLYFSFFKNFLTMPQTYRLLLTGAVLGLLIASFGVFWEHAPAVMGIPEAYQRLPLFVAPIVYALLWRYAVKPLNEMLGLQDS